MEENSKKFSTIDIFLIAISILTFVGSIYALYYYDKQFGNDSLKQENSIAVVEKTSFGAKRRSIGKYDYATLQDGELIGNGDSLLTSDEDQLILQFNNGPRLSLGSETLMIIRESEGRPDLKIEKGVFSGTFNSEVEIEVSTDKESAWISGDAQTAFSVKHLYGEGLEIGSYDKEVRVTYKGETQSLTKQRAWITSQSGLSLTKAAKDPNEDREFFPKKLSIDTTIKNKLATVSPPYPEENHVFIHQNGGLIPIFPKSKCSGACEVSVFLNDKVIKSEIFARNKVPVIGITVTPGLEGFFRWEFSDGDQVLNGGFEVKKNSQENFQNAIDRKLPVEVMN